MNADAIPTDAEIEGIAESRNGPAPGRGRIGLAVEVRRLRALAAEALDELFLTEWMLIQECQTATDANLNQRMVLLQVRCIVAVLGGTDSHRRAWQLSEDNRKSGGNNEMGEYP